MGRETWISRRIIMILLAWSLGFLPCPAQEVPEAPRHVLQINSYDQRMSWVQDITRAVEDVLQPEANNLILHVFNMDSKRYHSGAYFESLRGLFRAKYGGARFSLILVSDDNAFDFVKRSRDELFPGVPVVFCGLNDFGDERLRGLKGFTGVAEVFSARETVELMLRLHPETREIFIINDYLESGRKSAHDIEGELAPFRGRVRFTHNADLPMEGLRERSAGLGKDTAALLGVYYADRDGRAFTFERVGSLLAEASHVPVYALVQFNIGRGVVGGKVISGYYQGHTMAILGQRILAGESPDSIPVVRQGANHFIFDHVQLRRFGLSEASLPPESLVINRPASIYETHKKEIWALVGFICALLAIVAGLVSNLALRRRAEGELRRSEARLRQIAEASWEGILVHDHGIALSTNRMFLEMFGFDQEDPKGLDMVPKIIAPRCVALARQRITEVVREPYELAGRRQDGTEFPMEVRVRLIDFAGREVRVAAFRDLTGQKRMEEQLAQSQKMEAVGTLSGGIAHDFNNILSAILGYTELLQMEAPRGSRMEKDLGQILKAADRAKALVQQILTFSRQAKRVQQSLQMGSIVKEAMKMLRASLPATIDIQYRVLSDAHILADPTQVHQVVMNLCTNAALAMRAEGGCLEVTLDELRPGEAEAPAMPAGRQGSCLRLTVRDTGCGMSPEVQQRIFEPFFTTRPQGEGTGLGLSVVHGIVKSLGGTISVHSEPGRGSTFHVLLPALPPGEPQAAEAGPPELPLGTARILFVDDEEFQVDLAARMLGRLGYQVTVKTHSEEALALFQADPRAFDLLISDMTMPKMPGDVLVARIRALRPGFPAILCTGYSDRLSEECLRALGPVGFAMKPLNLQEIAGLIHTALAKGAA